jgi:peptidyl-dipeptidase Dcp
LAYSGEQLDAVSNIFFNLNSAETNDEIQKIAQEVSPLLSEYSSQISQNEALFNRIKKFLTRKKIWFKRRTNASQRNLQRFCKKWCTFER